MLKYRAFIPAGVVLMVLLMVLGFGRTITADTSTLPETGFADSAVQELTDSLLSRFTGTHAKPPIVLVHGWQGANIGLACQRHDAAWADENWARMDEYLGDGITFTDEQDGTAPFTGLGFHVELARLKSGGSISAPDASDPDWDCTPRAQDNVPNLIEAIDAAKAATGQEKVILIAHSMGGLVSRAYLEDPTIYRDDVVALYTLGTPHIGVPIGAIETLIEVLTLGIFDAEDYCGAQPVVCQFSDDENNNPAGFSGIETFNATFNTRAPGVYYHLIGGDAILTHRGTVGTTMAAFITGPDDGIVPQASALGVSSGDGRLAPLSGAIDRLALTPTLHIELFTEDPTCLVNNYERHFSFHDQNLIEADCPGTKVARYIPSVSFLECLSPSLLSRNDAFACGSIQSLSRSAATPREASRALSTQFGMLEAARADAHLFEVTGGEVVFAVHSDLEAADARLDVALIAPDGSTVSVEELKRQGATVKVSAESTVFWLNDAASGTWQIAVQGQNAPADTRYIVKAIEISPDEHTPERLLQNGSAAETTGIGIREASNAPAQTAHVPQIDDSLHSCAISQADTFQVGDTVDVTFTLTTSNANKYPEYLDLYFIDAPDGWNVVGQSAAPLDDSAWNRATGTMGCNDSGVAYWGLSSPLLAGLDTTCDLAVDNLPTSGSWHGAWGQTETVAVWSESFEGAFPPAGWQMWIESGDPNDGFTQSADRASDGSFSARHNYHNVGFFDSNPRSWLVSPMLTLEAGDVLVWDQYAQFADDYDTRELYVSTGSGDPADGDFRSIGELFGTYDTWEQWFYRFDDAAADDNAEDRHDYSGREDVYFAFYYEGDNADRWYIDNVRIEREVVKSSTYEFTASYEVADTHLCPGSNFVGVSSAENAQSGLAGLAMGDLVDFSTNTASCNITSACPVPEISLDLSASTDGTCSGSGIPTFDAGPVELTLCYTMNSLNTDVAVVSHTISGTLHSDLTMASVSNSRATVTMSETVSIVLPNPETCYSHSATWTADTAPGLGQPQDGAADGPFAMTQYEAVKNIAFDLCTNPDSATAVTLSENATTTQAGAHMVAILTFVLTTLAIVHRRRLHFN